MRRERQVVLIVGAPASGKTTVLRALMDYADAAGERVRVVDPCGQFKGRGELPRDGARWLEERVRRRDTTTLVLDELDRFFPHNPPQMSVWMDVCNRHRHLHWDVLATTRRLQQVAPALRNAVEHMYVFRMNPADREGRKAVAEAVPGLPIPSEPFRFAYADVYGGRVLFGRTLPGGGYVLDHRRGAA